MTNANVFNLVEIYKEYFPKNSYFIDNLGNNNLMNDKENYNLNGHKNPHPKGFIHKSTRTGQTFNKIGDYGQNIWFPIKLESFEMLFGKPVFHTLEIDICTVSVNLPTNIVSTPILGRKGCVHEIVSLPPNRYTVRGFLIGKNRTVPEAEILKLKHFHETLMPVTMHGGYVELFLFKSCKIIIESIEFPEVQGKNHWIRPFTMVCYNDDIEDMQF